MISGLHTDSEKSIGAKEEDDDPKMIEEESELDSVADDDSCFIHGSVATGEASSSRCFSMNQSADTSLGVAIDKIFKKLKKTEKEEDLI
jgi:hypothetical protein